ncbi:conserved protein of unknown function [Cupriavidus taiwanensis]|uniref:PLD phosphodiesterase domain-containing protein n=1 Tax=Cupriavidus taiwanensis TaxID=164546 RepID=A0A375ID04_9BURK|nr:hypothetical protein [Cupriavidus taiwanensis]SPK72673.1 conserved protein of unknown function [Cupriavidus taiwanensis]
MSANPKPWPAASYLDALRPPAGQQVRYALLASYSADLWSIGATLLALIGSDLDSGRGSRADMAGAIESLKGRVSVAIQRGRLARPRRMSKIAAVLDQFISEVSFDESHGSWHPKIALLCYEQDGKPSSWRLWIGSKNLTRAWNLDFGLTIEATVQDRHARAVDGVADLGHHLASVCQLAAADPKAVRVQLDGLKWTMPRGIKVHRIALKRDQNSLVHLPPVKKAEKIVVVSPFLDGTFVKRVGEWGNGRTQHVLISTEMAVRKLACQAGTPLQRFGKHVYVYDHPELDESAPQSADMPDIVPASSPGEDEVIPFGLHAKILAVASGRTVRMWVGSANATQRGWMDGNAEVIAELECDTAAFQGLEHLIGLARPVAVENLRGEVESDLLAERLEDCRRHLAASLSARLHVDGDRYTLRASEAPELLDPEVKLRVGLATTETVAWPQGQRDVPLGSVPIGEQTGLVRLQLVLGTLTCEWMQKFDIEPGLPPERDLEAIAAHLGPQQFLAWVRAMLNGGNSEPDDPNWDDDDDDDNDGKDDLDPPTKPARPISRKQEFRRITLEEMLSCWNHDPHAFAAAQSRIETYAEAVLRAATPTQEERDHIEQLRSVWKLAQTSLGSR